MEVGSETGREGGERKKGGAGREEEREGGGGRKEGRRSKEGGLEGGRKGGREGGMGTGDEGSGQGRGSEAARQRGSEGRGERGNKTMRCIWFIAHWQQNRCFVSALHSPASTKQMARSQHRRTLSDGEDVGPVATRNTYEQVSRHVRAGTEAQAERNRGRSRCLWR